MTDILSKHNEIQKEKREKLMRELEYYKRVRERNLILIKQLQEEADKYDELYKNKIDELKGLS